MNTLEREEYKRYCQRCESKSKWDPTDLLEEIGLKVSEEMLEHYKVKICPKCLKEVCKMIDDDILKILSLFGRYAYRNKMKSEEVVCLCDMKAKCLDELIKII